MGIIVYCSECGAALPTTRAVYWHLRKEHGLDHEEAFETAGNSLSEPVYGKDGPAEYED